MKRDKNLRSVSDFIRTKNASLPKADISNSGRILEGDPFEGGPDPLSAWTVLSGEPDDYSTGDAEDEGDPDDYSTGDSEMEGGPRRRRRRPFRLRRTNTAARSGRIARRLGRIARNEKWNFMYIKGGIINSTPIPESSGFPSEQMSQMLNRQNSDSPFLVDQALGGIVGTTLSASLAGPASFRLTPIIWIKIGTSVFTGIPNSLLTISVNIPLFNGSILSITAPPITATYSAPFNMTLGIVPWTIVSSVPTATLCRYGAAPGQDISVTVSGLPLDTLGAPSTSSLVVMAPGTQHKWTQGMRNAFLRA
jgi:hypothetical protein